MIIQSLILRDFKSYAEQTIDLNGIDSIGICGPNGAGKSTIIEAITFALYGKCTSTERKELGNEAIIRDDQDEAFVSLNFEKDNQEYTVERTVRKKGTGTATLRSNERIMQAGAATVTVMVQSIVGMDYETFVSSTIIRQNEMDKISDLRPSERKDILSKIFGLELYDKLKKTTHEKLSRAEAEVEAAELLAKQLTPLVIDEEVVRKELDAAVAELKLLANSIRTNETELVRLETEIAKSIRKKSEYDVKHAQLVSLDREINSTNSLVQSTSKEISVAKESEKELYSLKEQLQSTTNLELQRLELEGVKEQLTTDILQYEQQTRLIEQSIDEEKQYYNKIQALKAAECPLCKRPLDDQHRHEVLEEFNSRITHLRSQLNKVTESLLERKKHHGDLLPKLTKIEEDANKTQKLQLKKAHLEGAVFQLARLTQSERDLKSRLRIAEAEKNQVTTEMSNLEDITPYFEELQRERNNASISLVRFREAKGRNEETVRQLRNQLAKIDTARKELDRIRMGNAAQREEIEVYEILENAFGKDGIPTSILKSLVPEVEEDASRILHSLSNGQMRISFRFGRETKSGAQTDQLVLEAADNTGNHPVTRFSGGERMRINLALRLGISEVIARRSGYKGKIETLIIDEGLSALDEEGRLATIEILRHLRQRFRKILVISHLDDVKDAFETRLLVSKSTTGQSIAEIQ